MLPADSARLTPCPQEEGGSHSDDNKVLESYRAARLAQLQAAAARNKYGAVSAGGCGMCAVQPPWSPAALLPRQPVVYAV